MRIFLIKHPVYNGVHILNFKLVIVILKPLKFNLKNTNITYCFYYEERDK